MCDELLRHVGRESLARLTRADAGQDLLEYGLLVALISIIAMGAVTLLGQQIDQVFWQAIAAGLP